MRIFQPTMTGSMVMSENSTFSGNMSGSLTKLTDGTSYIIAGSGMTVTTGSNGAITLASTLPTGFLAQAFGAGFDGDLTVADGATVTLTRETQYNSVTILGSGSIKPAGYRLFCKGNLSISEQGSINDDGTSASGGSPGSALAQRGYLGGQGLAGATGVSTDTAGTNAATQANCSYNESGSFPAGGKGGNAGARAGGSAITGSAYPFSQSAHTVWQTGRPMFTQAAGGGTSPIVFTSGIGGSSGGNNTGAAATSGAGGTGGGNVWISAYTISNSGRISANGGTGGTATGTGNAGGGGGGSGGIVTVITTTPVSSIGGTISVNGGGGGAGIGTGLSGNSGSLGSRVIVSYGGN